MADMSKRLEKLSPEQRELILQKLKTAKQREFSVNKDTIPIRSDNDKLPLSFAQERLWFLDQLIPHGALYNISAAIELHGKLDYVLLEKSINIVLERHQILRTAIKIKDGMPVQKLLKNIKLTLSIEKANGRSISKIAAEQAKKTFDLGSPPLIRVKIIKTDSETHALLLTIHHIVSDGWSMAIFINEVATAYNRLRGKQQLNLPVLPIQYFDYADWQKKQTQTDKYKKQLTYWEKALKGMPPVLSLPFDHSRPPVQTYSGHHHHFFINEELTEKIRTFCRKNGMTPFTLLLSAFQTLLYRLTAQNDFGVGIPIANRNKKELEPLIGFFVNTIVLRARFDGTLRFIDFLQQTKRQALEAFDRQDVPFEKIVERVLPERDNTISPLFQVMFDMHGSALDSIDFGSLHIREIDFETGFAKFDLNLTLEEQRDRIKGVFEYNTDLFEQRSIERFTGYFIRLVSFVLDFPETAIEKIPFLSSFQKNEILKQWRVEPLDVQGDAIHYLIEKQAEDCPENFAVGYFDQSLTFSELNRQANRLANFLLDQGIQKEDVVAIFLDRSPDVIVSMLAIWKSGGAYLPIDPSYPLDRIQYILEDSRASAVITDFRYSDKILQDTVKIINIESQQDNIASRKDSNPCVKVFPENSAYIIYTSGSTGRPKGVVIQHHSALNLAQNLDEKIYRPLKRKNMRISLNAPILFDASAQQIVMLTRGHGLQIIPDEVRADGKNLLDYIEQYRIQIIDCVPSQLKMMIDAGLFSPDRWRPVAMLPGGEAIDPSLWEQLYHQKDILFFNMYGPTECTVDSTLCPIQETIEKPSIGQPIRNVGLYILDKNLQPIPAGVTGELYICGAGLARGYLHKPDLTADNFMPDPFSSVPGSRMYKTGDLVRQSQDGHLEFVGRADFQVKVRGFRIDLGEIENVIRQSAMVKDTIVLVKGKDADSSIVAYCLPDKATSFSKDSLKDSLRQKLPSYMIPDFIVVLNSFPFTPNGKIDKNALPDVDKTQIKSETKYIAPRNALEKYLAQLWSEMLGVEKIGVYDNFFDLGGNSLKAAMLINRIQEKLKRELHIGMLFQAPCIAEFALFAQEYFADSIIEHFGKEFVAKDIPKSKYKSVTTERQLNSDDIRTFHKIIPPLKSTGKTAGQTQKNKPAVFILSPPRSGSTLLRVMLAGNPRLFSPPELDLLSFNTMGERYAFFKKTNMSLWLEAPIHALKEALQLSVDEAIKRVREFETKDLPVREFYRILQSSIKDRLLVDKTPSYSIDPNILQRIEEDFDQPYYIHLLRHPYAMIYSFIEAKLDETFFKYTHPFSPRQLAELFWMVSHQNILNFFKKIPAERRYTIHFEDLLTDPKARLKSLTDFLGIPFSEEMLKPYQGDKMTKGLKKTSQMVGDFKFYLHQNIDASVAERWKKFHKQDFLCDSTISIAEILGYDVRPINRAPASLKKVESIPRASRTEELELSFAQQRLWFIDQLEPGLSNYNIPAAIRVHGRLDASILIKALYNLAERHESLRTIFLTRGGKAYQTVKDSPNIPIERISLKNLPPQERLKKVIRLLRVEARNPFNLSKGPLLRVKLIELEEEDHIFMLNMHHIISDGWSVGIIIRDLIEFYQAHLENRSPSLPDLPIQYADYAQWQRDYLSGGRLKEEIDFWDEQFRDAPALLELPYDRPRPSVQTFNGRRFVFRFSDSLSQSILDLAKKLEVTPYAFLLTVFQLLLHRYSGQDTVIVGTPVANRDRKEIENLVGFFVNTLVIRADFADDPDFITVLQQIKQRNNEAFAHKDLPFEKIVDSLNIERNLSHNPLFQVMFAYQPPLMEKMDIAGLRFEPVKIDTGIAKFDLTVSMAERNGRFVGEWEYNTDLWDLSSMQRMNRHFIRLLKEITTDPFRPVKKYPLLSLKEEEQILDGFSSVTETDYPSGTLLHTLFEKQVERTPMSTALVYKDMKMSYQTLNKKANQLAHYLIQRGVQPEEIIGISMERSFDLIIAIFAVLKAGGAYVPLDPAFPQERLAFMVSDTKLRFILTQRKFKQVLAEIPAEKIAMESQWPEIEAESVENPAVKITPQNMCYVIYTSGSTGWPKGVMVQHDSAIILAYDYIKEFKPGPSKRFLQFFSYSFDGSVGDFFMTLFKGASLYLVAKEESTPDSGLVKLIQRHKITNAYLPPSILAVLRSEDFPDLATVASGGDVCTPELVRKWADKNRKYYNGYGPTETTVCATLYLTNHLSKDANSVPIGKPIPHYRTYILDKYLNPVPIGVSGELYIGGKGVTRGYLNRPDLTAEKFLPDPYSKEDGARMYASGDLCRYLPDGNIEFLGRIDQQVKIRGFRIELGEIESALLNHPAVNETVVLAKGPAGNKQLVAYLVTQKMQKPSISDLRDFLKNRLPEYMIPAYFMFLDKMPVSAVGKIDRRQLPEPELSRDSLKEKFVAASDEREKILVDIWKELLNLDMVGIKDNFFELGGDSILSIQMIARARQRGLHITPKQLFETPTIEGLAASAGTAPIVHAEQETVSGPLTLTPIQRYFFEQNLSNPHHWNQSLMLEVSAPLDTDVLLQVVRALIRQHDVLRLRFNKDGKENDSAYFSDQTGESSFKVYDFSTRTAKEQITAIKTEAERLQASLNIWDGPLFQVAYFKRDSAHFDRLFIVIHHLVIDGLSWRILTEDLLTAYEQASQGQSIQLPPKTTSFQYWAQSLEKYAHSEVIQNELDFWLQMLPSTKPVIPVDITGGINTEESAKAVSIELSEEKTKALLQEVPSVYNTEINDALLTALFKAYKRWSGQTQFFLQLEGHGREQIAEDIDVSRTVGWFTTMYPLLLKSNQIADTGALFKSIKEQLRKIPNKGIGYGLHRYILNNIQLSRAGKPDISFNYLGQFDQLLQKDGFFRTVHDLETHERGIENIREFLIDISASVKNNRLFIQFIYSKNIHKAENMKTFASWFKEELNDLIEFCRSAEAGGYTPSDFRDVALEEEEINNLLSELDD